jgi:glutaredoxin
MSKAVIYSKDHCPWCVKAKQLLTEKGVQFEELIYGTPRALNKEVISEAVGRDVNTLPQIILDGVYIGGYTDLARHYGVQ